MSRTEVQNVARCRACPGTDLITFLSLGHLPLPDALLTREQLTEPEPRFPTDVAFCPKCSLVQLLADVPREVMFVDNYRYYSSFSDQLLAHSRDHVRGLVRDRHLDGGSLVIEIASNDGYLLSHLVEAGVPVLGIDPAPGPAQAARDAGVPTLERLFGRELAAELIVEGRRADVIVANNVMAHVPDLEDFVGGIADLLADDGVVKVENPSVQYLIEQVEFDTIYHEHVCYYSCTSVERLMRLHGLYLNDVEEFLDLHGGTLRWTISRQSGRSERLEAKLADEHARGMLDLAYYSGFASRVTRLRDELHSLIRDLRAQGHSIAAYGAAAKGTVLLNHVGLGADLIDFVVDRNTHKHGRFMPGVHIPIVGTEALVTHQPDDVLLLAWNFADEIAMQQRAYLERGGRFIRPVPAPQFIYAPTVA